MFYIYAKAPSTSAQELTKLLEGIRVRRFDGFNFSVGREAIEFKPEDILICWGSRVGDLDDVRVLNHSKKFTRYYDLRNLANQGISCVRASELKSSDYSVGRLNDTHDGQDLVQAPVKPDFWVRREQFKAIYRVHSFAGKSIRAGIKEVRSGFEHDPTREWEPGKNLAHPWVWTYDLGWKVRYEGFQSDKTVRMLAHKALRALGLTFGVVDIGMVVNSDATVLYKVIDVNRFPHVEGETLNLYVKHIQKWASGPPEVLKATVSDDEGTEEFYVPPSAAEPPPMPTFRSRAFTTGRATTGPLLSGGGRRIRRSIVDSSTGPMVPPSPTPTLSVENMTYSQYVAFRDGLMNQWQVSPPTPSVPTMPNVVDEAAPVPTPDYHFSNPFDGDDDA